MKVTSTGVGSATLELLARGTPKLDVAVTGLAAGDGATIGIRPESLFIGATAAARETAALPARIESVERLGNITYAYFQVGSPDLVTVQVMGPSDLDAGQDVRLGLPSRHLHVFNAAGGAIASAVGD